SRGTPARRRCRRFRPPAPSRPSARSSAIFDLPGGLTKSVAPRENSRMSEFLLWVIPAAPFLAAAVVTLGVPLGLRSLSPWPVSLALAVSPGAAYPVRATAAHETLHSTGWRWIDAGGVSVAMTLRADTLTLTMLSFITLVSLLIAIYSIGYMAGSPGF